MKNQPLVVLVILLSLIFSLEAKATHLAGGVITYEYVSDSVYDVNLLFYRDCNGVAFSNPSSNTYLHCITTGKKIALSLSRSSIKEVSYLCPTASRRCNPSNTYGTGNGLEEHRYTVRIDFRNAAYKPYYGCGQLVIQTEQCCRTTAMSTGLSNTRYFNYSTFDVSDSLKNSSPYFNEAPQSLFGCNKPAYIDVSAKDKDGDSLSYHLTDPLEGWNNTASYTSGYNAQNPVKVYGTSINPNASPPTGFYFDSTMGHAIFTPTRCDNVSAMVVTVKEWRKNSKGVYEQIGAINREIQLVVSSWPNNNLPTIKTSTTQRVCEGKQLALNIETDDTRIWPAPTDSVKVSWNNPIDGATYKIPNASALHQTLRFEWTPPKGSASNVPYKFIFTATDNHCPYPGKTTKVFSVFVNKPLDTETTITSMSCGNYVIKGVYDTSEVDSPSYQWHVLDTSGRIVSDTSLVKFGGDSSVSFNQIDTLTLRKAGTYILVSQISKNERCTGTRFDTIYSIGTVDLIPLKDTLLCQNDSFTFEFTATQKDLIASQTWQMNTHTDTSDTFSGALTSGKQWLYVTVTGIDQCNQQDSIELTTIYSPKLEKIEDTVYCKSTGYPTFVAVDLLDSGNVMNAMLWSTGSANDTASVMSSGKHWVKVSNRCGFDSDSFDVLFDLPYTIDLGSDQQLCDLDSIIIGDSSAHSYVNYLWNTGDSSENIIITQSGVYTVRVTNGCNTMEDSIEIQFDVTPLSVNWPDTTHYCDTIQDVLDALNPGAQYHWHDGSTNQTNTVNSEGLKWVEVQSRHCGSMRDSIYAKLNYSPRLNFSKDTTNYCDTINDMYDAQNTGATYLWDDGSTNQTKPIRTSGWHSVVVSSAHCGSVSDSIYANLDLTPMVNLGTDTMHYCDSIDDLYDAKNSGANYTWNDGSTGQTKVIDKAGWHTVTVSSRHCGSSSDSIYANLILSPSVNLGKDTAIKSPINVTLDAQNAGASFVWNTGDTTQTVVVDTPGTYWVQVTNRCGTDTDTIEISSKVSITDENVIIDLKLIPNPTKGAFRLIDHQIDVQNLWVFDAQGREVEVVSASRFHYELIDSAPGVYVVYVQCNQGTIAMRLIVE